jgi:hypothetical protein
MRTAIKEKELARANSHSLPYYRKAKRACQSPTEAEALNEMADEARQEKLEKEEREKYENLNFIDL